MKKMQSFAGTWKRLSSLKILLLSLIYQEVAHTEEKFMIYEKVKQALLKWFTLMHVKNIFINGPLVLEELAILLMDLILTLFKYQTDGLEDGKKGTSRLPLYSFLHLKIHNKESGLNSEKYCQWLVKLYEQTNYLISSAIFFTTSVIFMKI